MPVKDIYKSMPAERTHALRRAVLVNGADALDWNGLCDVVSAAHNDEVVDRTVEGFDQALKDLRGGGGGSYDRRTKVAIERTTRLNRVARFLSGVESLGLGAR